MVAPVAMRKWTKVNKSEQKWTKVDKSGQKWTKVDKSGQKWTKVDVEVSVPLVCGVRVRMREI
jgi:hypothetical protein